MTGDRYLAERYGPPVRNEQSPLEDWTELDQARHRTDAEAEVEAYEAGRRKAPSRPVINGPLPAGNPPPRARGRQERKQPVATGDREQVKPPRANGTTLEELLGEW
jgi:hypothetical protein